MNKSISKGRKTKIALLNILIWSAAILICLLMLGLVACILYKGLPHITAQLLTTKPSLINGTTGIGDLYVNTENHTVLVNESEVVLSFKEFALLSALLDAGGKVLSREQLFMKVWGEYYGESRTLDVHIRNLRNKLGASGQYIQTVKNIGYKIGGEGNAQ